MNVLLAMLIAITTQQQPQDQPKSETPKGPTELTIPIEKGDEGKVIQALSSIELCKFDCGMGCDLSGYPQSSLDNCPKCGMLLKKSKLPLKDQIQVSVEDEVATLKFSEKMQGSYVVITLSEIDDALKGVDAARRWKSLTISGPFQIHTAALEYKDAGKEMEPKREPYDREPRKEPMPPDEPRKKPPEENQNRQQADQPKENPERQDQPKRVEPAQGLTEACDRLAKVKGIRSTRAAGHVLYVEADNASWDEIKESLGETHMADVSWIVFPGQGRIGFNVK